MKASGSAGFEQTARASSGNAEKRSTVWRLDGINKFGQPFLDPRKQTEARRLVDAETNDSFLKAVLSLFLCAQGCAIACQSPYEDVPHR